ncbi:hypothetical protein LCGC14_3167620, partial [marine sediment metagenome]
MIMHFNRQKLPKKKRLKYHYAQIIVRLNKLKFISNYRKIQFDFIIIVERFLKNELDN